MIVAGLIVVAVALVRGSGDDPSTPSTGQAGVLDPDLPPGTTAPLGDEGLGTSVAPAGNGRSALAGFGEAQVTITSPDGETCVTCMLLAADRDQRERGLMEVTDADLGGYDAMVFAYDQPVEGSFWMRNTPLPLTISYLDDAGTVISMADLEPCADLATCPSYPARGPFQYAVEVPVDRDDPVELVVGSTITIEAYACSEASDGS